MAVFLAVACPITNQSPKYFIMQLSSFLQRFNEPETLKMAKLGRELRARGVDVIDLSLGEPDFDTPQHIKDAAVKAIQITGAIIHPYRVSLTCGKPFARN